MHLARERQKEAWAACRIRSVPDDHIHWLCFADGQFSGCVGLAAAAVAAPLNRLRPAQVFIPCGFGPHSDHAATGQIVLTALELHDGERGLAVVEYPI